MALSPLEMRPPGHRGHSPMPPCPIWSRLGACQPLSPGLSAPPGLLCHSLHPSLPLPLSRLLLPDPEEAPGHFSGACGGILQVHPCRPSRDAALPRDFIREPLITPPLFLDAVSALCVHGAQFHSAIPDRMHFAHSHVFPVDQENLGPLRDGEERGMKLPAFSCDLQNCLYSTPPARGSLRDHYCAPSSSGFQKGASSPLHKSTGENRRWEK